MQSFSNSVKKCPNCKQWSAYGGDAEEKCSFCDEYLDPYAAKNQITETERKAKEGEKKIVTFIVEIKPDDSVFIAGLKRIVQFGQLVFMAIVSFLLWFAAIVTG